MVQEMKYRFSDIFLCLYYYIKKNFHKKKRFGININNK